MAQHSQQEPADSTVGGPLDVVLEQLQQMNTCDMADALETTDQVSREAVQALAEAAEDLSALQQQGAALIVQLSSLQEEPAVVARLQASAVADGESLLATRAHILGAQSRAEAEHASALRGAARKALALAAALFSQGDKASKGVEGANQAALQMQRQAAALQEVGAASQAAAEACDRTTAKLQQLTQPTHTHGTTTTKAGSDQGASSGGGGVAQPRDPHTEQALQQQAADLLAVRAELMAGKVGVPEAWAAVHQAVQLLSDLEASA